MIRLILSFLIVVVANLIAHAQETITDFCFPWSTKASPRTSLVATAKEGMLILQFDVEDEQIVSTEEWAGESTLDGEDRVEFFFAKNEALDEYWCIEVDPLGRVHDYQAKHYRKFDSSWNCPGLVTEAIRTKKGYEVSVRIPLETIGRLTEKKMAKGSKLLVGFFRAEFFGESPASRGDSNENWISWVKPTTERPDFHVPSALREWTIP